MPSPRHLREPASGLRNHGRRSSHDWKQGLWLLGRAGLERPPRRGSCASILRTPLRRDMVPKLEGRDVTLQSFVDTHGDMAIMVGTFFEGETILVLGGVTAHRGYPALPGVIASAFLGSLVGDQLFSCLGRRHGDAMLAGRSSWRTRVEKATALLEPLRRPVMIGFRFLCGVRTVTPFAIGMSRIPAWEFFLYNAAGFLLRAMAVGSGRHLIGNALELFLSDMRQYEKQALAAIASIGLLAWRIHFLRRKRQYSLPTAFRLGVSWN